MDHILNCIGHELKIPNIVKSEEIYLFDDKGNKYMDLESGVWCTVIGHNNKRINQVIKKQINSVMHTGFCYFNRIIDEAARSVLDIANYKNGKCVFLCSGSESIELARQTAKHLTKKKRSMTLSDSYLGSYSSVINRKEGWFLFDWQKCKTCEKKKSCDQNCELLKQIPGDISEFIFEPGSSGGFVRFPPKAVIQNIVKTVKKNGGKIITNEVTTGIGRTGKWFGYNHYDIEPDMVAMGKGIGNGYPVSVTAINKQTVKELDENSFRYSQSHQNDPLGAAVVKEVIDTLHDEDLILKAAQKGKLFFEKLKELEKYESIVEVRGRGLMLAIDIINEKTCRHIFNELIKNGCIVCDRKTALRIDPALIIEEKDILSFIQTLEQIINIIETG